MSDVCLSPHGMVISTTREKSENDEVFGVRFSLMVKGIASVCVCVLSGVIDMGMILGKMKMSDLSAVRQKNEIYRKPYKFRIPICINDIQNGI